MPPVRIDLSFPRIAEDIRARHELLYQEARALIGADLDPNEVYDDPSGLLYTVDAYFLLSEAYKITQLGHVEGRDEHWTEPAKKAALTTLAIMLLRPIQPLYPNRPVNDPTTEVANQIFSLSIASSLMGREFGGLSFKEASRLYRLLGRIGTAALPVRAMTKFRRDVRAGRPARIYDVNIDRDMVLIDSLILLYEAPLRP